MSLALLTVGMMTILFLTIAFIAYSNGNKQEAIMLRNGVYSFVATYIVLVLLIGCVPIK